MKKIAEIILPEDRFYTSEHIWAKQNADVCLLGISDFAQDQLGEIAYVELPALKQSFEANQAFGTVESLKSVNSLFMPIAGTILEVNLALEDNPTLLNADCYENWIVKIKVNKLEELNKLLNKQAYKALLEK